MTTSETREPPRWMTNTELAAWSRIMAGALAGLLSNPDEEEDDAYHRSCGLADSAILDLRERDKAKP